MRATLECNSCGSEVDGDFYIFCEEGCPVCGSHDTDVYGRKKLPIIKKPTMTHAKRGSASMLVEEFAELKVMPDGTSFYAFNYLLLIK